MTKIIQKYNFLEKVGLSSEVAAIMFAMTIVFVGAAQASDITVSRVVKLVNEARSAAGVAQLKQNERLQAAAEQKAQDMFSEDYFAHVSPQGKSPWDFIQDAGYDYRFAGENLAINYTNADQQQAAWMNSQLHRKNILNPDFQEIGVAVESGVIDGHKTTVTVQEFGTQMGQAFANVETSNDKSLPQTIASDSPLLKANPNFLPAVTNPQVVLKDEAARFRWSDIQKENFFENKTLTIKGWLSLFAIALFLALVDVAALFHKKHRQLLILHEVRQKHA